MSTLTTLPNLARSFAMMKLQEKLGTCRSTSFGLAVQIAVANNQVTEAVRMVQDQIQLGNIEEIEWCVGASTVELINKLYPC